jgi:membrane protein DedA with SNARE-associated domain
MGPYTLLAMGSGYSFCHAYSNLYTALVVGTVAVFLGAWTGAIIAFTFGRFICRK